VKHHLLMKSVAKKSVDQLDLQVSPQDVRCDTDLCGGHSVQRLQIKTVHASGTGDGISFLADLPTIMLQNNYLAAATRNGRSATPLVSSDVSVIRHQAGTGRGSRPAMLEPEMLTAAGTLARKVSNAVTE